MAFWLLRCAGTHGRSALFPLGNQGYSFVSSGNLLACRIVCLVFFILAHRGRFLLEQPSGSYLEWHPRVDDCFKTIGIFTGCIWGGSYATHVSDASAKRHKLWSNDEQLLQELVAAGGYLPKSVLDAFGQSLVKKRVREDGSVSFSGNKETMQKSQPLVPIWGALQECFRMCKDRQ